MWCAVRLRPFSTTLSPRAQLAGVDIIPARAEEKEKERKGREEGPSQVTEVRRPGTWGPVPEEPPPPPTPPPPPPPATALAPAHIIPSSYPGNVGNMGNSGDREQEAEEVREYA
jgi:hypothetical protein